MSTIIIRLQNLPLSAKAADIREFFGDLKIPKGSVNIVGGPYGDAFIGFASDEDARLAMQLDGRLLHKIKIRLMLSSKLEMEQVITNAQALADAAKQQIQNAAADSSSSPNEHKTTNGTSQPRVADRPIKVEDGQWEAQKEVPPHSVSASQTYQVGGSAQVSQPQTVASFPPLAQPQQSFGEDSWKNPQKPFVPPVQKPSAGAQQIPAPTPPVFPNLSQPSYLGIPPPTLSGVPQHQPQYQQLASAQPPGFPPPLNIPNPTQQQQHQQPIQPPIRPPSFTGQPPTSLIFGNTGGTEGFFNQQTVAPTRFQLPPNFGHQLPPFGQQQGKQQPPHQYGQSQQQQSGGYSGPPSQQFRPQFGAQQPRRGGPNQGQQNQAGAAAGGYRGAFGGAGPQQGVGQQKFQPKQGVPQQQHFPPPNYQQQPPRPRFDNRGGGGTGPVGIGQQKRQRSRSPEGPRKRFFPPNQQPNPFTNQYTPAAVPPLVPPPNGDQVKERVCVQLSNIPYKAQFNDIRQYLSATKAKCVKVTRVYMPDRNYSDRWIVEFDNEQDAREVIKYRGEITSRSIRAERITSRRADEQYAVTEPEPVRRDDSRRNRDDRDGRDRSRNRDRDRNRSRSRSRERRQHSREGRGRDSMNVWVKEELNEAESAKKGKAQQHHLQQIAAGHSEPTSTFGAFSFPGTQIMQGSYNSRTGQIVQTGDAPPVLLRAFELFPPPLPLLGKTDPESARTSTSPPMGLLPPAPVNNASANRGMQTNANIWATTENILPLGLQRQPSDDNPAHRLSPPEPASAGLSAPQSSLFNNSLDASELVIHEDYLDEDDSDVRAHIAPVSTSRQQLPSLSAALNGIPDQPPLDLLEPETTDSDLQQHDMMFVPLSQPAPKFSTTERRSFDSAPITAGREFTQQELEFRPQLAFLERYKDDPNVNSCIRLENVPKMVFAEQLCEFLGVQLNFPSENIARMQNGVLYINLANEELASKAATRNMLFLSGHQIAITKLKRSEMADAIRQNMIIVREMYRLSVVARGFPLMMQPNEIISMFERFNVNKDGVEKCAVRPSDSVATFLLTFPSAQDCQNAIRELNNTQISGGARIQVFQPTNND